jgi:hypothetical protein
MRGIIQALLPFILSGTAPALAQTPDERARLDWAEQRGRLLYEVDRAAWVTTDDLRRRVPDLRSSGIRGWIVERDGAGYAVTFYAGEGDARVAAYRARVANNRVAGAELIAPPARPPLTPLQRRLADARQAVGRAPMQACARSGLNLAVITPDTPDGPMDVYVLTPQTEAGTYPMGGHNRMTIAPSGEVLSHRAFTNSCLNLSSRAPGGGTPVALMVSHVLDPIPTEVHVFLSIWVGLPLYVATTNPMRAWRIEGGRIRLVDRMPGTPPG